MLVKWRIIEY